MFGLEPRQKFKLLHPALGGLAGQAPDKIQIQVIEPGLADMMHGL